MIIGAGPTGLAAGLFLVGRGIRSRTIDKADAPGTTSRAQAAFEEEERVATIPQVFIGSERIGGSDDLERYLSK